MVVVKLSRPWTSRTGPVLGPRYQAGDVAGFADAEADEIVRRGCGAIIQARVDHAKAFAEAPQHKMIVKPEQKKGR